MSSVAKLIALAAVVVLTLSATGVVDRSIYDTVGDFVVRSLDTLFLKLTA